MGGTLVATQKSLLERALPDIRDYGLKNLPVQQQFFYSRHRDGIPMIEATVNLPSVRNHGEFCYLPVPSMCHMSQDWKRDLVEMHGNSGSMDDPPAAPAVLRRLSEIAGYLLQISENTLLCLELTIPHRKELQLLPLGTDSGYRVGLRNEYSTT